MSVRILEEIGGRRYFGDHDSEDGTELDHDIILDPNILKDIYDAARSIMSNDATVIRLVAARRAANLVLEPRNIDGNVYELYVRKVISKLNDESGGARGGATFTSKSNMDH